MIYGGVINVSFSSHFLLLQIYATAAHAWWVCAIVTVQDIFRKFMLKQTMSVIFNKMPAA
jgi:hypothetical protein